MFYSFPRIENLEQVRNIAESSKNFVVKRDDETGLLVVNYLFADSDTFPEVRSFEDAVRREFRGITFDVHSGRILVRKYHKFFNVGERDETQPGRIDLSRKHIVLNKLDGSMITPVLIGNEVRYCTKMGLTTVAVPAEIYAKEKGYDTFCREMLANDYVPIFEWCSLKQRIVLTYEEDSLILTAIRHNVTGEYLSYEEMREIAARYSIPVVSAFGSISDLDDFLVRTRTLENAEGYVIRFEDGHMVKIKSEWYVSIHKTLSMVASEKSIIRLLLSEKLDDAIALMDENRRREIMNWAEEFSHAVIRFASELESAHKNAYSAVENIENPRERRKAYATEHVLKGDSRFTEMLFALYDRNPEEVNYVEEVWNYLRQKANKIDKIHEKVHELIGVRYAPSFVLEE